MFINKTNIKLLAAALLTALAAPSCLNLDETQDAGYGYLTISGLDLDIQVEQLVPTKAGETTVDISDIDGYYDLNSLPQGVQNIITVEDKNGNPCDWEGNALPYGDYTVKATCGSNGFGRPYYTYKGTVKIESPEKEVTINYSLANSVVQVINNMEAHVNSSKQITISSSEVSGEVITGYGSYVFVPSGKALKLSGTNTAGTGFSYNLDALEACKAYDVTLTPSGLPELELSGAQMLLGTTLTILIPATIKTGSANSASIVYEATDSDWDSANKKPSTVKNGVPVIEDLTAGVKYRVRARIGTIVSEDVEITPISVSAVHSYTDGFLDGTNLKISNVPSSLKDKVLFSLAQGETTYRSGVKDNYDEIDHKGSDDTSWPYLPQGTYNLTATCDNVSTTMNITVEAPSFTVNTGAYTSYTKYSAGDVTGANSCDAGTIYNLQSMTPTISDVLLSNTNYTKSSSVKVDNNSVTAETLNGQSWSSHTVTPSYTFAGTTCSTNHTVQITGLPYEYKFYDNEANIKSSGWTGTYAYDSATDKLCIRYAGWMVSSSKKFSGYIISPEFYFVEDIKADVQCSVNAQAYSTSSGAYKPKLQVGVTSNASILATEFVEFQLVSNLETGENYSTCTPESPFKMDKDNKYISIGQDGGKVPSEATHTYLTLHSFQLLYSEK